jgi:tetratricopeptide (TPR) repeat protein
MRRAIALAVAAAALFGLSGQRGLQATRLCDNFTTAPRQQIRACTEVLSIRRTMNALAWRAAAYTRAGDVENARRDYGALLAWVQKEKAETPQWYNFHCWISAILNLEIDSALKSCNDALRMAPGAPGIHDSRALVYVRLGQFDKALADYDVSLAGPERRVVLFNANAWDQTVSMRAYALMGRAIAKSRLGDAEGSRADTAAAEKQREGISAEFAVYGLRP